MYSVWSLHPPPPTHVHLLWADYTGHTTPDHNTPYLAGVACTMSCRQVQGNMVLQAAAGGTNSHQTHPPMVDGMPAPNHSHRHTHVHTYSRKHTLPSKPVYNVQKVKIFKCQDYLRCVEASVRLAEPSNASQMREHLATRNIF